MSNYGKGGDSLTPYERGRLRATVDAAALERYLADCDDRERRAAIAYFAEQMLVEDLAVLDPEMSDAGDTALLSDDGRILRSNVSIDLDFAHEDARRQALWKAIEVGSKP